VSQSNRKSGRNCRGTTSENAKVSFIFTPRESVRVCCVFTNQTRFLPIAVNFIIAMNFHSVLIGNCDLTFEIIRPNYMECTFSFA